MINYHNFFAKLYSFLEEGEQDVCTMITINAMMIFLMVLYNIVKDN